VLCAAELAWQRLFGRAPEAGIRGLLPRDTLERIAWCVVALSVGFCEEVVYRGYLQKQLAALSGRVTLGLALQAALFGIAHLEQGFGAAGRVGLYGVGLGALALFRGSLVPGIIAHVAIDLAVGLTR
jgi:membrane protease YdiL (CAAX protease family)